MRHDLEVSSSMWQHRIEWLSSLENEMLFRAEHKDRIIHLYELDPTHVAAQPAAYDASTARLNPQASRSQLPFCLFSDDAPAPVLLELDPAHLPEHQPHAMTSRDSELAARIVQRIGSEAKALRSILHLHFGSGVGSHGATRPRGNAK